MRKDKVQPALADLTFVFMGHFTEVYNQLSLPVISTGRSFKYYRRIFFDNQSASTVLRALQGQCVLDVGCGLTPYVSNSMFQACYNNGVDFYGIDPKLSQGFKLGSFDRIKIMATGSGQINRNAPGLDKAIATSADKLPFADNSVDLILSCYLLFAWIADEDILEAIFSEFHRVLKLGGRVKIFPAPAYATAKIRHQGLRQISKAFETDQVFLTRAVNGTQFPPAYMRTMLKR